MNHLKSNTGNALITAIFVMSLVAIVAMALALKMRVNIQRTTLGSRQLQRVQQFENLTQFHLIRYAQSQQKQLQSNTVLPPIQLEKVHTNLGHFGGQLLDAESYFNINSFFAGKPEPFAIFKRLLIQTTPHLTDHQASDILAHVMQTTIKRGREYYLSVTELQQTLGSSYAFVSPYLVALPTHKGNLHPLHSYTALLLAFYPQLNQSTADNLLSNNHLISWQQSKNLFEQAGIELKPEQLQASFIIVKLQHTDTAENVFSFSTLASVNHKKVKIVSENWFVDNLKV